MAINVCNDIKQPSDAVTFTGASIFDGENLLDQHALVVSGGLISAIVPQSSIQKGSLCVQLDKGVITPGFVDLQVNGGGGVMFNSSPDVETLQRMSAAHAGLGVAAFLPTLITDTPANTAAAVDAVVQAIEQGVDGIVGLHLEGPHLSIAKKGAHSPGLIRPMNSEDLTLLLRAAERLPLLKVTVSTENVTLDQIKRLAAAGVLISLGHTTASYRDCVQAVEAGARCVTHLFNAMSQLQSREAGTVGAALDSAELSAGLIVDGVHVDYTTIGVALAANRSPGQIFLVSDSMATAGSEITSFELNGRRINRQGAAGNLRSGVSAAADQPDSLPQTLTLEDGTLAGADLELARAVSNLHFHVGVPLAKSLAMATSMPARVAGFADKTGIGFLKIQTPANFNHLTDDLKLQQVWRGAKPLFV